MSRNHQLRYQEVTSPRILEINKRLLPKLNHHSPGDEKQRCTTELCNNLLMLPKIPSISTASCKVVQDITAKPSNHTAPLFQNQVCKTDGLGIPLTLYKYTLQPRPSVAWHSIPEAVSQMQTGMFPLFGCFLVCAVFFLTSAYHREETERVVPT